MAEIKLGSIQIEPDECFGEFQRRLQRSIDLASVALRGQLPHTDSRPYLDVFPNWFVGSRLPQGKVQAAFELWIKGHLLSDLIEALEPLIDCAYRCAVFSSAPAAFTSRDEAEEFRRRFESPPADGRPLGPKLEALRRDFPSVLPDDLYAAADPLRRLRNCLTHGGGVVRPKDCDASGQLRVDGLIWDLVFVTESGEELAVAPGFVSPGGTLAMRRRKIPLAWPPGQQAAVSERDLLCIAGTLNQFATQLRQNLYDQLRASGRLPPEFEPSSPKMRIEGIIGVPNQEASRPQAGWIERLHRWIQSWLS